MASHKRRNGTLNVCWYCKNDMHDECMTSGDYVCHCTCQPACTRPECQVVKVKTPRRRPWKHDDPRWGGE